MPRDGSGNYTQPFPPVVTNTPIASSVYNGFTADVSVDLNTPRPIVAGGTGATSAAGAMTALGGEFANQVVNNYASFGFVPGSFSSPPIPGLGAPVDGQPFVGICYGITGGLVLEARNPTDTATPPIKYVKRYTLGAWGPWLIDGHTIVGGSEGISAATGDMFFGINGTSPTSSFVVNTKADMSGTNAFQVNKAGGAIVTALPATDSSLSLFAPTGAHNNFVIGSKGALSRWAIALGNSTAESGSNVGSDFALYPCTDAGATGAAALSIARSNSAASFSGNVSVGGTFGVTGAATLSGTLSVTGASSFGSVSASSNIAAGGAITAGSYIAANSYLQAGNGTSIGSVYFGNTANNKYLTFDGTNYHLIGGGSLGIIDGSWTIGANLTVSGTLTASAPALTHINTNSANFVGAATANVLFYNAGGANWSGIGCDSAGNLLNYGFVDFYWYATSATQLMHLSSTGSLFIAGTYSPSDERLKTNVQTLGPSSYFDQLRPVSFKWKDEARSIEQQFGLIAQEVQPLAPMLVSQETTVGASAECPDPMTINYTALIPELIAQIQELKARVAVLESSA